MADELLTPPGTGVRLEREYDATPEQVWACWIEPERLARWLGPASGPLGDEPVRLTLGDGPDEWADVAVVRSDPPALLELRWTFPGQAATVLRVEITAVAPDRTRLVVEHRGLGAASVGYGAGWHAYLVRIGAALGATEPPPWDAEFAAALPGWRARAQASS